MMVEEIINKISEFTGVPEDDLLSRKKDNKTFMAKKILMYILTIRCNMTKREIASIMGCSRQNVSYNLIEFDQDLRVYKGIKLQLQALENALFQL